MLLYHWLVTSRRFFFYIYLRSTSFCHVCSPDQAAAHFTLPAGGTTHAVGQKQANGLGLRLSLSLT